MILEFFFFNKRYYLY